MKFDSNFILLIIIAILIIVIIQKIKPKQIQEIHIEEEHPQYPFVQYDIREVLAPSRRTYLRYPYYPHRYGIFMR